MTLSIGSVEETTLKTKVQLRGREFYHDSSLPSTWIHGSWFQKEDSSLKNKRPAEAGEEEV